MSFIGTGVNIFIVSVITHLFFIEMYFKTT